MKRKIPGILAALLIWGPMAANAAVVLDQDYFGTTPNSFSALSNGTDFGRAQTFTVGEAGFLDSIDVGIAGVVTSARILATFGGAPIGGSGGSTVLAASSSVSNVGDVFTFDFSATGLAVNVGDIFAIELFGNGGWIGYTPGEYSGGSDYFFNTPSGINTWTARDTDYFFRTYIETHSVPEPGTLALLGLGLVGMGMRRRIKAS